MNQTAPDTTGDAGPTPAGPVAYRIALRSAAVAGVFSLIVCALLLYDYRLRREEDPLEATPIRALKLASAQQPDDEKLDEQIRALDLRLREEWFRRRAFSRVGAWLLLGGMAVFLIAARSAATLRRKLPSPAPQATPEDVETRWTGIGRWVVAGLALVLAATAVTLNLTSRLDKAELAASSESNSPGEQLPAPPPPAEEEIRKGWPRFRGPGGLGVSAYTNVPDSWDDKSGKNILWKERVPLPGYNSPVVWADRLFLSGATEDRREVYCFDAHTGKLLWRTEVAVTPQGTGEMSNPEYAGYAAPTTVTDGRWVFAMFANGDVAALDYAGRLAWTRGLGIPKNSYGHGASLAMFKDFLLVQFDQGTKKDGKSRLLALDVTKRGKTAWQVTRQVPASWPTPILIRHAGRDQIITCTNPWVIAYAPADGKELWRANCLRQDVGPSPTFANGLVYAVNEFPQLTAIRPDGEGDVTKTHVVWIGEDGLPQVCSPLATDQFVFLVANDTLTCYDAKQGGVLWEEYEAFDYASFTSSPSLVGNRVYLFGEVDKEGEEDEEGNPLVACKVWVLEPGREGCKVIGVSSLDEACVTSPAFQDGRIYIRVLR